MEGAKIVLKSGLKKPSGSSQSGQLGSEENTAKGRVQWLDFLGEELAEIKEFEPSNSVEPEDDDDDDDDDNEKGSCLCIIQ